jgi:hypothetical protein
MCHDDSVSSVAHRIGEELFTEINFLATGHRVRSSSQLAFVVTHIFSYRLQFVWKSLSYQEKQLIRLSKWVQ